VSIIGLRIESKSASVKGIACQHNTFKKLFYQLVCLGIYFKQQATAIHDSMQQ